MACVVVVVFFLTPQSDWSPFISQARLLNDDGTTERLQSIADDAVDRRIIVEPFFIKVRVENGVPVPVRFRERLRVRGPSTRVESLKPALSELT